MAFDIISRSGNRFVGEERYCMTSGSTNDDITITLFESGVVPTSSCIALNASVVAVQSDFTTARTGTVQGTFIRAAGNIAQDGTANLTVVGGLGVIFGLSVNTTNQTILLTVKGIKVQTVNYRATIRLTIYK